MQGDILFLSSNPSTTSTADTSYTSQIPVPVPDHRQRHNYRSSYKSLQIMDVNETKMNNKHLLLATLSNSQKFDPVVFQVWMNVLTRLPGSKLVILDYKCLGHSYDNLVSYIPYHGQSVSQLVSYASYC